MSGLRRLLTPRSLSNRPRRRAPSSRARARAASRAREPRYKRAAEARLWQRYGAVEHWAKVERPRDADEAERVRARLRRRFGDDLDAFRAARAGLDPRGVLGSPHVDALFSTEPPPIAP